MSASEKLRALVEDDRWLVSDETIAKALASALPQIVAVVEAAEEFGEAVPQYGTPDKPWASELPDSHPFMAALAALEEALS